MSDPKDGSESGIWGWNGEVFDSSFDPAKELERRAAVMRTAHAKVWDGGRRRPEATDADYSAWVDAAQEWQDAQDYANGRGPYD